MSGESGRTIVRLQRFVEQVRAAEAGEYRNRPTSVIRDEAAFEEMRAYLLQYYEKVRTGHWRISPSKS